MKYPLYFMGNKFLAIVSKPLKAMAKSLQHKVEF